MTPYYRNEYLFSEIYLQEITQQAEKDEILASLETIKEYRDWAETADIHVWKSSFVHEVLYALRFGVKAESDNVTLLYRMGSLEQPISVCYILLPEEDLDNTTMGRNWAEKIIRNLREHDLQWGVLTNGKKWRIYHLDEPTPYETYLEIDLAAILADKATEAFKIFHKFLQAENFLVGDEEESRFDFFKKESQAKIDYIEEELANALKQKEEGGQGVLSSLCMGYVEYLREREDPDFDDEELRHKIYHGAMLYMFRMLFLFYADARDLLSDENQVKLETIRQTSWEYHNTGNTTPDSYQIWGDLENIFVDIDQTYNGGLFNPYESDFTYFIEDKRVADVYLVPSIYHLVHFHEQSGKEQRISYLDISVRHLGTLYEGLLEHKLFIAKEDTEVRISKKRVQFIPISEGGKIISGRYVATGQVYFGSDSKERRTSGSFYTPEIIVNYIIEHTVCIKLIELENEFIKEFGQLLNSFSIAIDHKEESALAQLLIENINHFINHKVLTLSVVDPTMGSGHFLVNATNQIANFITKFLNSFDLVDVMDTSTEHWRRRVVENCIYGVDVNPLAVELAKLSLWILTMTPEVPLSFLNHHIKTGNSLIGARLNAVGIYPGNVKADTNKMQISLFEDNYAFRNSIQQALNNYEEIVSRDSITVNDIIDKRSLLDDTQAILKEYKVKCDIHASILFGNPINEWEYRKIISNTETNTFSISKKIPLFFHWELEFPDVFIRGGFDVVIGNPPWVSFGLRGVGKLDEYEENYYRLLFQNSAEYKISLYAIFIEAAIRLLNNKGKHSFIVPDSFLLGKFFRKIRRFILDKSAIERIVLFLEDFWPSASVGRCVIYTLYIENDHSKRINSKLKSIQAKTLDDFSKDKTRFIEYKQNDFEIAHINRFRLFFDDNTRSIIFKMDENSIPLAQVVKFYSGLIGKKGKASIVIDERPVDYSHAKYGMLISSGKYLSRYKVEFSGEYIRREKKLYKSGYDEEKYQNPKIFLNQTGDSLKACYDDQGLFCLNNMHIGYPVSDKYYLRFVNAILCSRLMNFYYHSTSLEFGRTMAQTDIDAIDLLPLPVIYIPPVQTGTEETLSEFINSYEYYLHKPSREELNKTISVALYNAHDALVFLVDKMLSIHKLSHELSQDLKLAKVMTDKLIDHIVYQLYGITEQEIITIESQEK